LMNLCIFHLGKSPITTRPLWKIFVFFITLKSSCFSPGQVAHYNKTTLKNLCIFHRFEKSLHFSSLWKIFIFFTTLMNLCIFHLGRSPITTRPLWKISAFFTKNLCVFSPGQVTHYNETTTLKNHHIFHLCKNLCVFHWVGHPWQFDHFKIFEFSK
jgi:hypothetical protein